MSVYNVIIATGSKENVFDTDDNIGLLNLFGDESEPLYQHNASIDHLSDNKSDVKDQSFIEMSSNEKGN